MLKEYRRVDDNIMLKLNTTNTHSEASCGELFQQMVDSFMKREKAIKYCLSVFDEDVRNRAKDPDNSNLDSGMYTR